MPRDRSGIFIVIFSMSISLALVWGCNRIRSSKEETDADIRNVLSLRKQAMETKDIDLYMSCISEDYQDDTVTYDLIQEKMEKNFSIFEKIDFSQSNQTIYQDDVSALVVQNFELSFTIGGEQDHATGKERIFLKRKEGEWKIVKGL